MKKINDGIVGYGWVAGAHIAAINATTHAQVTRVYSSRSLDSDEVSGRHGSKIACYTDLSRMLSEPDLHAVSICSYP
jgi:predicted dehydrogenase